MASQGASETYIVSADHVWSRWLFLGALLVTAGLAASAVLRSSSAVTSAGEPGSLDGQRPVSEPDEAPTVPEWVLIESWTNVNFAMGVPRGTEFAFSEEGMGGGLVDLSDGALIRFDGFQVMTLLADWVVGRSGSGERRDEPPFDLVTYDRGTGGAEVASLGGSLIQAVPGRDPGQAWLLVETGVGLEIRLVDLSSPTVALASYPSQDSIRLTGAIGQDPMVTAASSGIYRLLRDGLEFVDPGQMMAYSASHRVWVDCDDTLACSARVEAKDTVMGVHSLGSLDPSDAALAALRGTQLAYLAEEQIRIVDLEGASRQSYDLPYADRAVAPVWAGRIVVVRAGPLWTLLDSSTGDVRSFGEADLGRVTTLHPSPS